MCTINNYSDIKETLKNLCCSNGWCYGIFWGFHDTNSLLLTLKDAYYEEQMGALIDNMLLQVHVLGDGLIGQVAFTKDHQWMCIESYHQRHNCLESFESLEYDSELYYQVSLGIKTIALISVEPWGVVQFGSTHKITERTNFVDQVKQIFRNMDKHQGTKFIANDSITQFSSLSPCNISHMNENFQHDDFVEANDFFDFSFSNDKDCSVVTSFGHHLTFGLNENVPFSNPENIMNTQKSTPLLDPNDCKAQKTYGLLTLDDMFQENDVSQVTGLIPLSNLSGYNSPVHKKSDDFPANSIQSSLTDAFGSHRETQSSSFGVEMGSKKQQSWNETLIPLSYSTNESECISEKHDMGSNSLFSKLGLDKLLDCNANTSSFSKSKFDEQSSSCSKRRKTGNNTWAQNEVEIQDPIFYGKLKSVNPMYDPEMRNNSEMSIKGSSKRHEENAKPVKKKAKAGTKPRPKDRQMIQDRLAELRKLIPNGEKMSIDRLLERTIKHLNFMQYITIRAERLKQVDKQKSRGVQKDHSNNSGDGVTWACEVSDQTMVCPLIVEDLSNHGQMLIEMISEEEGLFLEIVDILRGFGLTILKGVMEDRETKKLAHFIVESEGTQRVTRHEVFSSLIQLLQMTGQSTSNVMSSGMPLFDSYLPAGTLQSANF